MISLTVHELPYWQTDRQTDRQTKSQTDTTENNTTLAVDLKAFGYKETILLEFSAQHAMVQSRIIRFFRDQKSKILGRALPPPTVGLRRVPTGHHIRYPTRASIRPLVRACTTVDPLAVFEQFEHCCSFGRANTAVAAHSERSRHGVRELSAMIQFNLHAIDHVFIGCWCWSAVWSVSTELEISAGLTGGRVWIPVERQVYAGIRDPPQLTIKIV